MGGTAPTRGRPRDIEADERIIEAATELFVYGGYEALSVAEVASRARVAKTTVYRRWPTKQHLVLGMIGSMRRGAPVPDSGDPRADVTALASAVAAGLRLLGPALIADLVAAAGRDQTIADGVHRMWADRKAEVAARVATKDAAMRVDQIFGALYYRLLITGEEISDEYVTQLVESVFAALAERVKR